MGYTGMRREWWMGKGGYGVAKLRESENRREEREGYMMSCIRNPDEKRAK